MSRFVAAHFMFLVAALGGCGSSSTPGAGGNGSANGAGGNGSGALAISADSTTLPASVGTITPSSGRHFEQVDATLANDSAIAEPIAFALFAVQTASGLRVQASPVTTHLVQPCAADQSLAPGGKTSCSLLFEVPSGETATLLVWLDPMTMASSTALLPQAMQPMVDTLCEQAHALKDSNPQECVNCVMANCVLTANGCSSTEVDCLKGCNTGANPCSCLDACTLSDACQQQLLAGYQCELSKCGSACN